MDTKHTPLIALQNTRRELESAEMECPHWDYTGYSGSGFECCHRVDAARAAYVEAKDAWRKAGGK